MVNGNTTANELDDKATRAIDFLIIVALFVFIEYKQISRLKLVGDKTIPVKFDQFYGFKLFE